MNEAIAANIRQYREQLSWTQEQLAGAANLDVRTVQRAESGRGMSAETLQAIAGAFNISVDVLRIDPQEVMARALGVTKEELTPELVEKRTKEMMAKYAVLQLTQVKSSGDLDLIYGSDSMVFNCSTESETVRDVAAELEEWLTDIGDLGRIDAVERRDYEKQIFGVVQRLNQLGHVVSIAIRRHAIRLANGPAMPFQTLYIIVAPKERAAPMALVEKNQRVSFK